MDRETRSLLRGELIGYDIAIRGSSIKGKIIDETKNTFVIETEDKKRKTIIKDNNEFEFQINNRKITINGKLLSLRPEDRIKAKVKLDEEYRNQG